jgi:exodeoxyribonuclease V beta subunit
LPADDALAGYAQRLLDPTLAAALRGYLTGSIDLVLRMHDAGRDRYVIIDYKTNWLAPAGEPLAASHYGRTELAIEMQRSHYVLQALLYSAALHRYLRWRLAGYDPETDLAGVRYLFLRGMLGPAQPDFGVFSWHPPAELVVGLSDLLAGGGVR